MDLDVFICAHTLTLNSIWLILITLKVNSNSSKKSLKFWALKCTLLFMIPSCLFVSLFPEMRGRLIFTYYPRTTFLSSVPCTSHQRTYLSPHKSILLLTHQLEIMTYILIKGIKIHF